MDLTQFRIQANGVLGLPGFKVNRLEPAFRFDRKANFLTCFDRRDLLFFYCTRNYSNRAAVEPYL